VTHPCPARHDPPTTKNGLDNHRSIIRGGVDGILDGLMAGRPIDWKPDWAWWMLPAFAFATWRGMTSDGWIFYVLALPLIYPVSILIRHWEQGREERHRG
jgi:hypothetical protein